MSGKKLLITGSNGMLGSNLVSLLSNFNIAACDSTLDITNVNIVNVVLGNEKPDIIIHTAAYTDVEACEINVAKAYSINTLGTQNLVNYCINKEILFIYISSTGIYGSSKEGAYSEFDSVHPTTVHHKSKYEGEKIIKNHLSKYLILRTGWLFGGEKTHNKNFVYKRFLEANGNEIIYSDDSQIGNPTYVLDLVAQIKVLIENKQYGVFNCVNNAVNISRFDYVKKIIELFSLNCDVKIAPKDIFQRIAPVSTNESAINYKLNLLGLNVMGSWEKSLRKYIMNLNSEI